MALRFVKVLEEHDRLWFCPTGDQKADGLTKSLNPLALRHIFVNHPKPQQGDDDEDDEEGEQSYLFGPFVLSREIRDECKAFDRIF